MEDEIADPEAEQLARRDVTDGMVDDRVGGDWTLKSRHCPAKGMAARRDQLVIAGKRGTDRLGRLLLRAAIDEGDRHGAAGGDMPDQLPHVPALTGSRVIEVGLGGEVKEPQEVVGRVDECLVTVHTATLDRCSTGRPVTVASTCHR